MYVCMYVCLSVRVSVCLSVCLSVFFSYIFINECYYNQNYLKCSRDPIGSIHLTNSLSVCLSVSQSANHLKCYSLVTGTKQNVIICHSLKYVSVVEKYVKQHDATHIHCDCLNVLYPSLALSRSSNSFSFSTSPVVGSAS